MGTFDRAAELSRILDRRGVCQDPASDHLILAEIIDNLHERCATAKSCLRPSEIFRFLLVSQLMRAGPLVQ